jgi:hypothetical protein
MFQSKPSSWGGGSVYRDRAPFLAWSAKDGGWAVFTPLPVSGYASRPVPRDTALMPDWFAFRHGPLRLKPRDESYMSWGPQVPLQPLPTPDHFEAILIPIMVQGYGLLPCVVKGIIALNRLRADYEDFSYCSEAAAGQMRVYRIGDPTVVPGQQGDNFRWVWEPIDFIDRPESFGPRWVTAPLAVLETAVPPIALPPAPSPAPPPPAPANDASAGPPFDGGKPYRPIPPTTPAPAPTPPAPVAAPVNDLLARYVRKQS